jgi:uncharacterized membrane protein
MQRRFWHWMSVPVVLVLALSLVPVAGAQSKELRWDRWDADIQINSDGTFTVQEEYAITFTKGEFTFGYRDIDISQFVEIRDIRVREGAVEYEESRSQQANTYYWTVDDEKYVISWFFPPTENATRVFTVEYTVVGGIIINEEVGDRFFWKAVGEHAFPVESSTVIVRMPPGATVDTSIEPALFGPDATCTIADDLTYVTFMADYIPANQEFEVGVRFPHGYVPAEEPPWQAGYEEEQARIEQQREEEQAWDEQQRPMYNLLLGSLGVLLLVGGPLAIYLLWLFRGRDPKVGEVPSYITEPPSDLPPGLAGTLLDEKADLQDIVATMVDLARRGAIEMEERERKVFGLTTHKDFVFRKKEDFSDPLRDYEKLLIKEVFGRKTEVELDDLKYEFYTAIPELQKALYKEAVEEGLFPTSPKAMRGRYLALGIVGLVLSVGVGFCVMAALGDRIEAVICPFVSMGITSIVLLAVSRVMPAKTRKGAGEAAKWNAFRTYLRGTERYADLESVTDQFDRYLPFAIAFGLERTWIGKFSRIESTPMPPWYIPLGMPRYRTGVPGTLGGHMTAGGSSGGRDLRGQAAKPAPSLDGMSDQLFGGLSSMSSGLFSMLNSTSRTFTSVPHSSSSGGGFSGGGFSGGGFSGGGGGGGGGAGFG